jgi:hypothetical protein
MIEWIQNAEISLDFIFFYLERKIPNQIIELLLNFNQIRLLH